MQLSICIEQQADAIALSAKPSAMSRELAHWPVEIELRKKTGPVDCTGIVR
jgi:hypothetical protein